MSELDKAAENLKVLLKKEMSPIEQRNIEKRMRAELPPSTLYMRYTTKDFRKSKGYTI